MFEFEIPQIKNLILSALAEDIGTGDITTLSTIPEEHIAKGSFIAKEDMLLCGLSVCGMVFSLFDSSTCFTSDYKDGDKVTKGTEIAKIEGCARSLLTAERTALNILQRMTGIATKTAFYTQQVVGTKAKIADTRKTTPGLRVLEKYAVRIGGGTNHRFNLSDGILIKDNHIAAAGSITDAVSSAKKLAPHTLKIEVEVENFNQLEEAISVGADIIMLDNMSIEDMKKAVEIAKGKVLLEASGNMDSKDLKAVANTGVDIISIGALTHTVQAADISLKLRLD